MKLIVSLLAASLFAHAALAADQAIEVDRIVAVVNSDVITRTELRQRVEQVTRQLSRQGTPLPPADVLERQVLERQIVERLQLQLAGETSLRVDDVALDRALGRIADNNRMSMTDFRKALEKDGISWERFRDEVRNEMLLGRVREREVESRIVVSDAEVATTSPTPKTPSARKSSTSPTSCSAPEGASPEQLARLRAKAEDVAARVARGEAFDKLAASYSDAPDALSGGNLGWRSAERLPGLFAEAVSSLKPGDTTPILRSAAGFHLVKVVGRKGGSQAAARARSSRPTPATSSSRPARSSPTPTPAAASSTCASASSRAVPALPTWPASTRPTSPPPRAAIWAGSTRATPCPSSSRPWTPSSRARSASRSSRPSAGT
jgi:peptidyl-prolyl cis-trans isomerase SurA